MNLGDSDIKQSNLKPKGLADKGDNGKSDTPKGCLPAWAHKKTGLGCGGRGKRDIPSPAKMN